MLSPNRQLNKANALRAMAQSKRDGGKPCLLAIAVSGLLLGASALGGATFANCGSAVTGPLHLVDGSKEGEDTGAGQVGGGVDAQEHATGLRLPVDTSSFSDQRGESLGSTEGLQDGPALDESGGALEVPTTLGEVVDDIVGEVVDGNCDADAAETPAPLCWERTFGGPHSDEGYAVQQTSDNGYVVAGGRSCDGAWVLKLTPEGLLEWEGVYYGGCGARWAKSIQQTHDNGYVVGASADMACIGNLDARILKLDSGGGLEWDIIMGGGNAEGMKSVRQTGAGGYIAAGSTASKGAGGHNAWVIKLHASGTVVWDKAFGQNKADWADSIRELSDGGYVVSGEKNLSGVSTFNSDAWVLRLDSDGNVIWELALGGGGRHAAHSALPTEDGGYIVAGYTESQGAGGRDVWILRLSPGGELEWDKTYGGTEYEEAYSIEPTTDGGYVAAGYRDHEGGWDPDAWILKLSSGGELEWEREYGGSAPDKAYSIQQTTDDGFVVAGVTESKGAGNSDVWVLKLDPAGNVDCD